MKLTRAEEQQTTFYIYKASEGGFGQKLALELLRGEGIPAEPTTAPYIGMTGVTVRGTKRVQRRAARILFSY